MMVISQQVEHTVDDQELDFIFNGMPGRICLLPGLREGDDHIAQIGAACVRIHFSRWEGKHVSGSVDSQELTVKILQLLVERYPDGDYTAEAAALRELHDPDAAPPKDEAADEKPAEREE